MTCSDDGSLRLWNLQTGQQIASWQDGESGIWTIALSVDGKKVISGSKDGVVRLWSIETGKVIARWTGHMGIVKSVCWNGDGQRVLSGSTNGTARVWDVKTGNTVLEINTGFYHVYTATFSPDSTLIATGGWSLKDGSIKIWDANTGKLVAILKGQGSVNCLAWTADGRTLISGSHDFTIRTWNTSTWQQLAVFTGHFRDVYDIAISPNGCILASASCDETAQLWNLENGQPIGSSFEHAAFVNCVSFSTDGALLATGCDDNNAYTWDVSAVIKEAGLNELLDVKKSFLQADATRRPVQQPKNLRIVPTGFFDQSPPAQHPDSQPTTAHPISLPSPSVPHDSDTPPELEVQPSSPEPTQPRFFKWFHSNTPARPTFLQWARLPFFKKPRRHDDEGTEMQEHPGSIVDVPLAVGLSRHAAAGGYRMKQNKNKNEEVNAVGEDKENGNENGNGNKNQNDEKEKQANIIKNTKNAAITSQPQTHWSNITQPVAGPSRAKQSSEPQAAATSPNALTNATSPPAIASSIPHADAVILRPRCCIPFLSCLGCASQYPDGRH